MKIGITGHQNIDFPENWAWVKLEIKNIISGFHTPIVGVTCLALGADQIFANSVLENGGMIQAIIPFPGYEDIFDKESRIQLLKLIQSAKEVTVLKRFSESNEDSYLLAGKLVVDISDIMIAVWDGLPAEGMGGTGDIVTYASNLRRRIFHINPNSLTIEEL